MDFLDVHELKFWPIAGRKYKNKLGSCVAHLEEQSLPFPDVRSSNPVIGTIYIEHCLLQYWKDENKGKRGRE